MPVKAFHEAKQRLAGVLDPSERRRLAVWMADGVVRSAGETPVFVVCDDADVRAWAEEARATVCWTAQLGLNGAVDDGVRAVASAGFDHVIVTHADLPLATQLVSVARPGTATFVPDRRRDGTNVMAFPLQQQIPASYGVGSFARHWAAAAGQPREIRVDAQLSVDVDTASDLSHPLLSKVLPTWLPTIPANRFTQRPA